MSATLELLRQLPHVAYVDDERNLGNSIIVTLKDGWYYKADPECGVRGFDTVAEAKAGSAKKAVYSNLTTNQIVLNRIS